MKLKLLPLLLTGTLMVYCGTLLGAGITFPEINGWQKTEEIKTYEPSTLWDYINGAAEGYRSYSFELLEVCDYTSGDAYITVEVYQHATPAHAFGIYSTERPRESNFLAIGTEGYLEGESLNFLKGSFYVKMHASGKKAGDDLMKVAEKISVSLKGDSAFPDGVNLLPTKHKVNKSTLFVAKNVLGYSFLSNGYLAEYNLQSSDYRLFLFVKEDNEIFQNMLQAYFEKCGSKKYPEEGFYALDDPYNGDVYLKITNNYAIGTLDIEKKKQAKQILSSVD